MLKYNRILNINKRFVCMLFLISFSVASFFAFCFPHPIDNDAVEYDTIGWNLAQGNGFSVQTLVPFEPTMDREPVYPFLLAGIYKVFGHSYRAVYVVQIFIFYLTCVLVYLLAKEIFNEKIAKYSAVFTALCPTLANYPSYILSEIVFTFLLCLSVLILTKAIKGQKTLWFFVAGIVLGVTVLCKAAMILFFFAIFLGVLLLKKDWKNFFKKRIFHLISFCFAFLIVISPWIYRNYQLFSYPQIRLGSGAAFWGVADSLDDSFEHMKQAAVFNFSEYVGDRLFPEAVDSPRDFILMRTKKLHLYKEQLSQQNFNSAEIDKIIKDEAFRKLRAQQYPLLKLLAHIPLELIKMTAFLYIPTLNETYVIDKFYKLENGKVILAGIRGLFRFAAYAVIILAIMGMWLNRKQWHGWYFLLAAIVYINFIYSILFGLGRYAVPLIPFYLIFVFAGILKLKQRKKLKQNE